MIEYLFPGKELHKIKPPRMDIGEFISFKGYNPLGKGQQAVHNSGSSMLKDTPSFKQKVLTFINDHFKYSTDSNSASINDFINNQIDNLTKFKSNKQFRNKLLNHIFSNIDNYEFQEDIDTDYLYISLILFFVIEYNLFKSTHSDHDFTKQKAMTKYQNEQMFLIDIFRNFKEQETINYISDVCFGRYYFLEVHFQEKENPRVVPLQIVSEFLLTQNKHLEDFDFSEQKRIQSVALLNDNDLETQNNRVPQLISSSARKKYKTDPRLSKTVLSKAEYKCEINKDHMTFFTKKGVLFSESHHLIPMAFQEKLIPINIDREENIVSLCPTCHRAVHLGNDDEKNKRLKILYDKKNSSLQNCGINISFDDLLTYYL